MAPGPALLGAAAGFMLWDGAGGLLSSVRGGNSLGWTVGGAAAGAGSGWLLWRMQLRSLRREQKHEKKLEKSSGAMLSGRMTRFQSSSASSACTTLLERSTCAVTKPLLVSGRCTDSQ